MLDWGREVCGDLEAAERREWLCTNGLGRLRLRHVAGTLTRRYHGLLVAALAPPLGRTLVVAKLEEDVAYGGRHLGARRQPLGRRHAWRPSGFRDLERFRLDGTTPVWTYACGDALLEKRVWMEPGANTTYVRYAGAPRRRARRPDAARARELPRLPRDDARRRLGDAGRARGQAACACAPSTAPRTLLLLAPGAEARSPRTPGIAASRCRGSASAVSTRRTITSTPGTFRATLRGGRDAHGRAVHRGGALRRRRGAPGAARQDHEADLLARWTRGWPGAAQAPAWIRQLVLAADQFVARRPTGRRARGDDDHRRLPLVRRLGPRHHDRVARAGAGHRPPGAGRARPAHVRALRRPRHAAQPLPRRRRDAGVQHRRRHALVGRGDPGHPRRHRRRRAPEGRCSPRSRASSTGIGAARATASARIPPTGCYAPASRACSSRGWTRGSATGW